MPDTLTDRSTDKFINVTVVDGLAYYFRTTDPTKVIRIDEMAPVHLMNTLKKSFREGTFVANAHHYATWGEAAVNGNLIHFVHRFNEMVDAGELDESDRGALNAVWRQYNGVKSRQQSAGQGSTLQPPVMEDCRQTLS